MCCVHDMRSPFAGLNVCMAGQHLLKMLCATLEAVLGIEVLNPWLGAFAEMMCAGKKGGGVPFA